MRIGQIAVGQKRSLRIQFSPERVLDMPILRVEIPEPLEAPAAPPGGQGAPEAGCEAGAGPGGVRGVGHAGVDRPGVDRPGAGGDGGVLPRHGAGGGPGRVDRGAYPAGGGVRWSCGGSA